MSTMFAVFPATAFCTVKPKAADRNSKLAQRLKEGIDFILNS
jgi:hypothetical protein